MELASECQGGAGAFGALLDGLAESPVVTDEDVARLRRAFYRRGGIDRRLAARLVHTNRLLTAPDPAWIEFYLEALTDFFLTRRGNRILFADPAEQLLRGWIGEGDLIANTGERRLVLRIMLTATDSSDGFRRAGFAMIRHNLLHEAQRLLGTDPRRPGVIDMADLQLIRKLVCGTDDRYPVEVDQAAVDFMSDLDRLAEEIIDRSAWLYLLDKNTLTPPSLEAGPGLTACSAGNST